MIHLIRRFKKAAHVHMTRGSFNVFTIMQSSEKLGTAIICLSLLYPALKPQSPLFTPRASVSFIHPWSFSRDLLYPPLEPQSPLSTLRPSVFSIHPSCLSLLYPPHLQPQ